jgi:hypothetical protein
MNAKCYQFTYLSDTLLGSVRGHKRTEGVQTSFVVALLGLTRICVGGDK